ncbi:MAG: NAD-dependent epimerase/dehydratase family protein [Agriterribacter sp.]
MVFVTGGTGLLGSYLLRELVARGEKVIALYRTAIPAEDYAASVQWIQGDILDITLLEEMMQQAEQVYHCAAMVSFNPSKKYELLKINAEGTANVVNAALHSGIKKLVYVSSVSAIGRNREGENVTELLKWDEEKNNSNYGRSKYFAEMEVWRGISEGLNAVIVNPTIILGSTNWEGSAALFKKAWEEFPWYTEGSSGFVDAADVAKVMVALMDSDITGERFILNAENWPFRKVFTSMANAFGKKPPHKKVTAFMASVIWRMEKIRSAVTGKEPLLTKETVNTAQKNVSFDNSKLLKALPVFQYKPLQQTIEDYCQEFMHRQ